MTADVTEFGTNGTHSEQPTSITIKRPNLKEIELTVIGTAPYMQLKFSEKARLAMVGKMKEGSTAKKGKAREARDFDADFEGAQHKSAEGWVGIPAPSFRNACIDACRLAGYAMTRAKMSIRVLSDGFDAEDGTPLVKLIAGPPERSEMAVRNATGVADIRVRPMWREWSAIVRIEFDADQFTPDDCANLLWRAGAQVGIGEGRPFSKQSNGIGMGTFRVQGLER